MDFLAIDVRFFLFTLNAFVFFFSHIVEFRHGMNIDIHDPNIYR